jgi:hypothetical protein
MFVAKTYDDRKAYTYQNKITLCIDSLSADEVFGHTVVAGNQRPFRGACTRSGAGYQLTGAEPGDDRYDGVFSFQTAGDGKLTGTWVANDKALAVSKRSYELEKRAFSYNPALSLPPSVRWDMLYDAASELAGEGEFLTEAVTRFNPSAQELRSADIENMYRGDLEVMRNSIYARHGYSFKNRKMRYVFDQVEWYMPVSADIRMNLTALEKRNIDLIKRYEEHAEQYYDSFGR